MIVSVQITIGLIVFFLHFFYIVRDGTTKQKGKTGKHGLLFRKMRARHNHTSQLSAGINFNYKSA